MGRSQEYRGNPEHKRYYLNNDFTGGINILDVDDNVRDNELRELMNVDLNVKGLLQNRKGFGLMPVLNGILAENSVAIRVGNYRLIKFVVNVNNVLRLLEDYPTLEEFNTATVNIAYKLHILLVINNFVYLLKIEKTELALEATHVSNTLLYTFPEFAEYGDEKISIQTIDFLDNIYFPINKIGTGTIGIGKYDVDDETFSILDNSVGYKPTPYEVSQIGFNVMSTDPLDYIDDQGIVFKSLRGIFLTRSVDTNIPITKIPLSGEFVLNVIHTGTAFNFNEVDLKFLDGEPKSVYDSAGILVSIEQNELAYEIGTVVDTGGLWKIPITALQVSGVVDQITIKLTSIAEPIDFEELSDLYYVGQDNEAKEVNGIDLSNVSLIEIDNRLVVYEGNTIYFSELFQFDYLPNYNFVTLPLQVTDEITKIVYFRGTHIIFTREEIYKMSGTFGAADFQIHLVNAFIGCIAPNTVRAVNNNIIFLSKEGLYELKSSVYQDGLENVKKLDKKITGMIKAIGRFDSIVYNEQYFLIMRNGTEFDVIRQYYNIDLRDNNHPFVRDKYAQIVPTFSYEGGSLYTIRGGEWFIYDKGYTDLMPSNEVEANLDDYTYACVMETSEIMFSYPTHDKKYKNIYVKTINGEKVVPLYITIKIDGYGITEPNSYEAVRLPTGEIEYQVTRTNALNLVAEGTLGQIVLGTVPLGETKQEVHKILVAEKGKNISLKIEQKIDSSFGVQDIGYLYKLSKVKENR